jgi:integrase
MARRNHDEGSVFQRKDGRWVAQVRIDGKMKSRYFKAEKEANAGLRKMLHEKEQGTLATGPNQLLKVYIEQWLEQQYKFSNILLSTYISYRTVIRKHIIPVLGHIQLQKLTHRQVETLYAKKLDEGLSASRVRSIHSVLHNALRQAVRQNLLARNVCDLANVPTPLDYEPQPLTPEQAHQLLRVAREHRFEVLLIVAIATGMRRGELIGLHWQDINFDERCLNVQRSVSRLSGHGIVESRPKTKSGRRKIMLPAFAIVALKRQREQQQEVREKAGSTWKEKDIVFCNKFGDYIEPSRLHENYKRLLKKAGLPDIRIHDLRHSAASYLAMLKVHPKIVQEILGHSNVSITLNIYSHMFPSEHEEAMGKMDSLFKEEKQGD